MRLTQKHDIVQAPLAAKAVDVGAAARALAAAKAATSSTAARHGGQVAVTETRRFAGKDVQVPSLLRGLMPYQVHKTWYIMPGVTQPHAEVLGYANLDPMRCMKPGRT